MGLRWQASGSAAPRRQGALSDTEQVPAPLHQASSFYSRVTICSPKGRRQHQVYVPFVTSQKDGFRTSVFVFYYTFNFLFLFLQWSTQDPLLSKKY